MNASVLLKSVELAIANSTTIRINTQLPSPNTGISSVWNDVRRNVVSILNSPRQMRVKTRHAAFSLVRRFSVKKKTNATMAKATRITHGTKRRQMNRSIMFSASIFLAHRGQPRAFCSSTLPQSRQVFVLIAIGPLQVKRLEDHR